jgi:hypothetical protein
MDALLPHTPSIISGIMTLLNNKNQPISVAGVPGDVQHLINEMMQIEPEFPEHLSLLINLRKNKPAVYNIALNQLKSL